MAREVGAWTASNEGEIDAALAGLAQPQGTALMIATDPFVFARRNQLAALASRYAIPTIHFHRTFAAAGGLISYGATITEETRMAGRYTGRILAGEKPGDLPILQPSKIELIINLTTAKPLHLTLPQTILGRADEVIE